MKKELKQIMVVQSTKRLFAGQYIIRDEKQVSRFIACNVASEYKAASVLLKMFYSKNPLGFAMGVLHQKRAFYEGDIYAYGYCGGFGVFLYEEPFATEHQVLLKISSPVDGKWYDIATGKHEIELDMFAKQPSKAKKAIELMVRLRKFSLSVNNDEIAVPWS